jgi:hypothetical protein
MTRFGMAVMAAALSLAAAQDEMIDNPECQGWKDQKAGAWVKWKTDIDAGGRKMESTVTAN